MKDDRKRTIITDRLNSESETIPFDDSELILPGSSRVELSDSISIRRKDNKEGGYISDLRQVLMGAVRKTRADAVMVSGGIDSSVLAVLADSVRRDTELCVAGFGDSEDVAAAGVLARDLGKDVLVAEMDDESLMKSMAELKRAGLYSYNLIMGATEYAAVKALRDKGRRTVISGIGSDELFFGFYRHRKMPREALADFRDRRLAYMNATDLLRLNTVGKVLNAKLYYPYLEENVIDYALGLDLNELTKNFDKSLLRALGQELGLSEFIVKRKKKAMQYGSGVVDRIELLSKRGGYKTVGEFIEGI